MYTRKKIYYSFYQNEMLVFLYSEAKLGSCRILYCSSITPFTLLLLRVSNQSLVFWTGFAM